MSYKEPTGTTYADKLSALNVPTQAQGARISRDKMFMTIAETVALRGTCDRAQVGAILVSPGNNIVSIGYNGSPHGQPHCNDVGHLMWNNHCMRTVHAEENCIYRAKFEPYHPEEGTCKHYTMYVTHYPCAKCQITLFEIVDKANIKLNVIYKKNYGEDTVFSQLKEVQGALKFTKYQDDNE